MRSGNGGRAAWNSRTNMRAVQTTVQLVVALCDQMEDWRRILRYLERLEAERERQEEAASPWPPGHRTPAPPVASFTAPRPAAAYAGPSTIHSAGDRGRFS